MSKLHLLLKITLKGKYYHLFLQVRKLGHREAKYLAHSHTATVCTAYTGTPVV